MISYDRLIRDSDVDLYLSHQVERIGEMQADYALKHVPKGNYVLPSSNVPATRRHGNSHLPSRRAGHIVESGGVSRRTLTERTETRRTRGVLGGRSERNLRQGSGYGRLGGRGRRAAA